MSKKRILVVEDDRDINELISYNLSRDGYDVLSLLDGSQVIDIALTRKPSLIVLDLMIPEIDGLELCRLLKADPQTARIPIIMLTAKGEESDVLVGLQMGADDYMTKPFSPKVLLARIKAILRRSIDAVLKADTPQQVREYAELTLDLLKHQVTVKGVEVKLTAIEFDILEFLSRHPGRVFSREQILDGVWKEGKFIVDRAVDVHIRGLRKKLAKADYLIETIRGVGYRFKEVLN